MEESHNGTSEQKARDLMPDWLFRTLLVLGIAVVGSALLMAGLQVFGYTTARLPLLLPLAVTVMSIVIRLPAIRTYEAVLKTSPDIAIGIISFDIWLLSARSEATGRVLVNPSTMIRGEFVLSFLVLGMVTAVVCLVLIHYSFESPRAKQRGLLMGLVWSLLVYVAPFGVLEPVPPPPPPGPATAVIGRYTVAIPYQDPGIIEYAPTFLKQRYLVHFETDVEGVSTEAAQASAIQRFLSSSDSDQVKRRRGTTTPEKVTISQDYVLVVSR